MAHHLVKVGPKALGRKVEMLRKRTKGIDECGRLRELVPERRARPGQHHRVLHPGGEQQECLEAVAREHVRGLPQAYRISGGGAVLGHRSLQYRPL